jgi:hypothetical protein
MGVRIRLGRVDSGIVRRRQVLNPVKRHLDSQLKTYIVPLKTLCLMDSTGDEKKWGMIDSAEDEDAIRHVESCEGIFRAGGSSRWQYAWYEMGSRAEHVKLAGSAHVREGSKISSPTNIKQIDEIRTAHSLYHTSCNV